MSDGFLGRWSRRKLDVKEGKPVPPEPEVETRVAQPPAAQPVAPAATGPETPPPPPPTLEEAHALTPDADFRRFAAKDVAADVKNAAMKKLFADPRYNIQDGLDTYIGDYSQPDPLPESMLRQLASAKFLGFFAEEEEEERKRAEAAANRPRDVADDPAAQTVAQSDEPPAVPGSQDTHADADLRLQQDDAAPGEDPGRGAERNPGAA